MKVDDLQSTLERHRDEFRDGLGKLQGYQAKIIREPEATPKFCKAHAVPYSMSVKIEEELGEFRNSSTSTVFELGNANRSCAQVR